MPDAFTTFSVLSDDAPNVYIAQKTYTISELNMQIGKFARKETLPQRMGTTLRIVRHKRIALPNAKLTEGVTPDAVALAIEKVDIPTEQWGIVVLLTDVAEISTKHPIFQVAIERSGLAVTEMLEREMAQVLLGGTKVLYGGTASSRATLAAADKMTSTVVIKATVGLRAHGAVPIRGSNYGGVMPPQVEGDLVASDTTFVSAAEQSNIRALQFGSIGVWMGVEWERGNFLPLFKGVAAPTAGAATAEKAQVTAADTGGLLTSGNYQFKVVARDALTDYQRKVSVQSANISSGTGDNDMFTVTMPSSTAYVYDLYMTIAAGTTPYLVASRQAASAAVVITANPVVAATPPANPADQIEVFVSWIFGKDAFARVELDGMSLQSYITPKGPSDSDPLAQRRKVGSKIMWKCAILDDNFMRRIETGSGHSSELAA